MNAHLILNTLNYKLTTFIVFWRNKAYYQRGHSAQYSGVKLATSTFVLSILELIFTDTSNKHCAFTITVKYILEAHLHRDTNQVRSFNQRALALILMSLN